MFGFGDVNQRRVIPLFISSSISNNKTIELKYYNNGRQFLHITDAICGYLKAASRIVDEEKVKIPDNKPLYRSPFTPTYHFAIENYCEDIKENMDVIEAYKDIIEKSMVRDNKCKNIDEYLSGRPFIRMSILSYIIAKKCGVANSVNHDNCISFAKNENEIQALDCYDTKKALHWMPYKSLSKSIGELYEWYRNIEDISILSL